MSFSQFKSWIIGGSYHDQTERSSIESRKAESHMRINTWFQETA